MAAMTDEKSTSIFREALESLNRSGVRFVIGGAFAVHHYTGMWRNTNDIDAYMDHGTVPLAVEALTMSGFRDFGEQAEGDRDWIFHAVKDGAIVDLIWEAPNHIGAIDKGVVGRGSPGEFLGVAVRFMPPEELVWSKLFTLNHDRTDWPDIFRLIRFGPRFDWERLVRMLDEHWPVLLSLMVLFDWVYPGERRSIPLEVREELLSRKILMPIDSDEPNREAVLDPWIYTRPYA